MAKNKDTDFAILFLAMVTLGPLVFINLIFLIIDNLECIQQIFSNFKDITNDYMDFVRSSLFP